MTYSLQSEEKLIENNFFRTVVNLRWVVSGAFTVGLLWHLWPSGTFMVNDNFCWICMMYLCSICSSKYFIILVFLEYPGLVRIGGLVRIVERNSTFSGFSLVLGVHLVCFRIGQNLVTKKGVLITILWDSRFQTWQDTYL